MGLDKDEEMDLDELRNDVPILEQMFKDIDAEKKRYKEVYCSMRKVEWRKQSEKIQSECEKEERK